MSSCSDTDIDAPSLTALTNSRGEKLYNVYFNLLFGSHYQTHIYHSSVPFLSNILDDPKLLVELLWMFVT